MPHSIPPSTPSLTDALPELLARSSFEPADKEAPKLERELRGLAPALTDVAVRADGGDVVVRGRGGEVRLHRMAVTGWWLAKDTYSPERAAQRVVERLLPGVRPISL
jgi:hypothetical protein